MTGWPMACAATTLALICSNWALRSGWCDPSSVLRLNWRENPSFTSSLRTVSGPIGCPISVSSAAAKRAAPAAGAANAPFRQRFRVEIILAAVDRRTREPGDLRDNGKAASPSCPHLDCRKQPAPTLIEMRAHRLPALPNRSPVDHATDLRRFAAHRNPQGPSHSAAGPQIAIQLMFGLSLVRFN